MSFVPAPVRTTGTALANVVTTTAVRTEQAVNVFGAFIGAAHHYATDYEESIRIDVADNSTARRERRKIERARDDSRFYREVKAELSKDPELERLFYETLADYDEGRKLTARERLQRA